MDNIKTIPTTTLIYVLYETKEQSMINMLAYELACRVYVPDNKIKTFEELLTDFGYRTEEKQKVKKLTK